MSDPGDLEYQLREYVSLLADENATDLIEIQKIYHHLKRMLGDEE